MSGESSERGSAMKALTGAVIALLTTVLVFFGFGLRPTPGAALRTDAGWQPAAAAQQAVIVNCGPGTQTLVRPVWMNGQQVSQVECVPAANGVVYPAQQQVRTVADEGLYDVRMTPAPGYDYRAATRRVTRPHRTWQKSALVIGGSTATGAGIGGLIGGKKGALIGAAIGGGASTIYEAAKRR